MKDDRLDLLYAELVPLIKASPGGVTRTEIREMAIRHGYSKSVSVESILARLPDHDCLVWGQRDEEKEVWYKVYDPNERRPAKMAQPKKGGSVKPDTDLMWKVKEAAVKKRIPAKAWIEEAIREKLAREEKVGAHP